MRYKLKSLRSKRKISQTELADRAGVSRQIISRMENGQEVNCTIDTLERISSVLGVSVSSLFLPKMCTIEHKE